MAQGDQATRPMNFQVPEEMRTMAERSVTQSLFECAISRIYADSAVSALSHEQALACKTGRPLLARSLWAGFRQPRRRSFFGQVIGIPHSNRLSVEALSQNWGGLTGQSGA